MVVINKTCIACSEDKQVKVKPEDLIRVQNGEHIQNVMPYLSADERELIISGICGSCFDKIFA